MTREGSDKPERRTLDTWMGASLARTMRLEKVRASATPALSRLDSLRRDEPAVRYVEEDVLRCVEPVEDAPHERQLRLHGDLWSERFGGQPSLGPWL